MRTAGKDESRCVLLLPYFGGWPVWMPAFLRSCSTNTSVRWVLLTDAPRPPTLPSNVFYHSTTLDELRDRASNRLDTEVALNKPFKLCDLRPAFAEVFPEIVDEFEYWGHCDLDIVWGDLDGFLGKLLPAGYDVISGRKGKTCGHFTLYRNDESINRLYSQHGDWRNVLRDPSPYYFDEVGMSELLNDSRLSEELSVFWDRYLFNFPSQPEDETSLGPSYLYPEINGWLWKGGKLFRSEPTSENEILYLHFMTWKRSLQNCRLNRDRSSDRFYVSFSHMAPSKWSLPDSVARAAADYLQITASLKRRELRRLSRRLGLGSE